MTTVKAHTIRYAVEKISRGRHTLAGRAFRGDLAPVIWPIAVFSMAYRLLQIAGRPNQGYDFVPVWQAVHAFLHHQPPYTADPGVDAFLYPPSALLMLAPFGVPGIDRAHVIFLVVSTAAIIAAGWLSLELFRIRWSSTAGAVMLLGLTLFVPAGHTLEAGQLNSLVLLGEVAALLAASRARWLVAGLFLGLTFAFKPVLAPLIIVPLAWRQWKATVAALLLPLGLSLVGLVLTPHALRFLSGTLPLLLRGQATALRPFDVSISGAVANLALPSWIGVTIRVAILLTTIWLLVARLSRPDEGALKIVEVSGIIIVSTLLCAPFAWGHYGLFLLPLIASLTQTDSLLRNVLGGLGLYWIGTLNVWTSKYFGDYANRIAFQRATLGYLLLIGALTLGVRRAARDRESPVTGSVPESTADTSAGLLARGCASGQAG